MKKRMNMNKWILLFALMVLTACSQEMSEVPTSKEGEVMAHISLKKAPLNVISWNKEATTRSIDPATVDEVNLADLWVVQFDNSGNFMKKEYYTKFDKQTFDARLGANYSGTTSTIYFLANIGATLATPDNEAAFKTQVQAFTNEADVYLNSPGSLNVYLPMFGVITGVTVLPSGSLDSLTATLYCILAKVELKYSVASTSNFGLEKVQVRNVPVSYQFVPPTTATTSLAVRNFPAEVVPSATSGTLVFYIPENLKGIGNNTDAAKNERLKDGTGITNATYIEMQGHVTGAQGGDPITFDIYLGSNNYNNYDLVRNNNYKLDVVITDCGLSDRRMSIPERANCYMMRANTTIEIPVTRANETELGVQIPDVSANAAWSASLLWQTAAGLVTVDSSTASKGYFKVTSGVGKSGNAVVIVKNNAEDVVWSWHIWVDDEDMNSASYQETYYGFTWMNRNLGATTGAGNYFETQSPLFYQWGRKDPYIGSQKTSSPYTVYSLYNNAGTNFVPPTYGTITTTPFAEDPYNAIASTGDKAIGQENALKISVRYPTLCLTGWRGSTARNIADITDGCDSWGGEYNQPKSLYDPCPAGWRVVTYKKNSTTLGPIYPSTMYSNSSATASSSNYFIMTSGATALGYYPCSGYRPGGTTTGTLMSSVGVLATGWVATVGEFNGNGSAHDLWASYNVNNARTECSVNDRTGRSAAQPIRCVKNWN